MTVPTDIKPNGRAVPNGSGSALDYARVLTRQVFDEAMETLIKQARQHERRAFADELVDKVSELTFRVGHIGRAETIDLILREARREIE